MNSFAKRSLDVVLAAVFFVATAPVFLFLIVLILLVDGAPVFFCQERIGRGGQPFRLCKLRTMRNCPGPQVTSADDDRQTTLGRWLRGRKLDELPQLWHVFSGKMSLVGPRPEVPEFVDPDDPLQELVISVRPGLVDPAVLAYLDEEQQLSGVADPEEFYMQEIKPKKLALSAAYIERANIWSDLGLLLRAGGCLLRRGRTQ